MLDKHLSHLKKHPGSMENMDPPPGPLSVGTKRSIKTDESPAASPATTSNWNSPNTFQGVSPAASNQADEQGYYSQGAYAQQGIHPTPPLYNSPQGHPIGAPQRPLQPQSAGRRAISEVSGGQPEMGDAKRQQMYAPSPIVGQQGMLPMQRPPR